MTELPLALKRVLLVLSILYAVGFTASVIFQLAGSNGLLFANGTPVGGDFINLWSAAKLVLAGNLEPIYRPDDFVAFERTIIDADIGIRLWAYPPQSLLLLWPFGLVPFHAGLALWSVLGLVVLGLGARRFGFDRVETAIILCSPASFACLYYGQTGNFACGLLLLALSMRKGTDTTSILAATLLTVKPQIGFLLPLLYAVRGRWAMIFWTGLAVLGFAGLSVLLLGPGTWRDYTGITLPYLEAADRNGTGPFLLMVPSMFMSMRLVLQDHVLAGNLQLAFAAMVAVFLIWRLVRVRDPVAQNALLMLGTVLITPYLLNYDLTVLLAGALLVGRLHPDATPIGALVMIAWSLPAVMMGLNAVGLPIAPLLILPLLIAAGFPRPRAALPAALAVT
ncbi:MAG TPA: glycosyltransferase family 87 protein [Tepidisphaeraceae bacterium]|nr:glycosyltransferase family 87 protein [Tepidisphaeraceae bacterium]